jgi:hypothetical protein
MSRGTGAMTSAQISPPESGLALKYQKRRRMIGRLLPWVGLILGLVAFLMLDYVRSAAIRHQAKAGLKNCGIHDPVRHHAFRANCNATYRWGGDSYAFTTNNLGFRDERVRDVPLTDSRPRVLMLGDSMTEGKLPWHDSFVGRISDHFPQYDFLNGGVASYSPSNYYNQAHMVVADGVEIDEVIVFIDISDVQDEATFYRDADASGAVLGPEHEGFSVSWWARTRMHIAGYFMLTNYGMRWVERQLVAHGYYHLSTGALGNAFDMERGAWTYRKVDETDPYYDGYAPLGVEAGIGREKSKMDRLWQELAARKIPISVVVYPHPAQIVHDNVNSRQVQIWQDWCHGKCKRFISLFPAVLAVKSECPPLKVGCWYEKYFVFGDIHYNAAGNALLADVLIKDIAQAPPVKMSTGPGAEQRCSHQ